METIAASIRENGFDPSQPIAVWHGVVVDGHTRLAAAKRAKLRLIPCMYHNFNNEYEALCYAYERQKNRRPESNADLLRAVGILDASNRKSRVEALNQGRDIRNSGATPVAPDDPTPEPQPRSSQRTATALGISRGRVEKIRAILDRADDDTKAAVMAGEKSIHTAYNETVKPKAEERAEKSQRPTCGQCHCSACRS